MPIPPVPGSHASEFTLEELAAVDPLLDLSWLSGAKRPSDDAWPIEEGHALPESQRAGSPPPPERQDSLWAARALLDHLNELQQASAGVRSGPSGERQEPLWAARALLVHLNELQQASAGGTQEPPERAPSPVRARLGKTLSDLKNNLIELGMSERDYNKIAGMAKGLPALQETMNSWLSLKAVLSIGQISEIVIKSKRAGTINDVIASLSNLQDKNFTGDQITKIASKRGGASAIEKVLEKYSDLLAAGYTHAQIVQIAGQDGGNPSIEAVLKHHEFLSGKGLSRQQIVRIAARKGGAKTIDMLKEGGLDDLLSKKFTVKQIVMIASQDGGSQAINTLLEHWEALTNWKLTPADITLIASSNGGSTALLAVLKYREVLVARGLTRADIVSVATRGGTEANLKALAELPWQQVFDKDTVVAAVSRARKAGTLQRMLDEAGGHQTGATGQAGRNERLPATLPTAKRLRGNGPGV